MFTNLNGPLFPLTPNFDDIFETFANDVYKSDTNSYPRSNIYSDGDDTAFITIAVTGIPEDALSAYVDDEGYLVVEANIPKDNREYLLKQYPVKSFTKKFWIDKKFEVGTIVIENGELIVRLNRVEPKKREIPIIGKPVTESTEEAA